MESAFFLKSDFQNEDIFFYSTGNYAFLQSTVQHIGEFFQGGFFSLEVVTFFCNFEG